MQYVLTVTGDDRPGIVADLADTLARQGGNWLESSLVRLAGTFAGVVLLAVPDDAADDLRSAVDGLSGLTVHLEASTPPPDATGQLAHLHLLGQDRPGIVAHVTRVLADHGVTIEEFETSTSQAPMTGEMLFEVDATVRAAGPTDDVRAALEAIAGELMVDIDLDAS